MTMMADDSFIWVPPEYDPFEQASKGIELHSSAPTSFTQPPKSVGQKPSDDLAMKRYILSGTLKATNFNEAQEIRRHIPGPHPPRGHRRLARSGQRNPRAPGHTPHQRQRPLLD